ncbi:unnamed protein product [Schistocephalus solidus]|uniref:Uncharacterized protein n=1 Tax=Schistocephalus solidus TaxID=70667 RepID=A0A183SGX1_SCHSO|nr:unnamed protein product [Schistocephalus solidus]
MLIGPNVLLIPGPRAMNLRSADCPREDKVTQDVRTINEENIKREDSVETLRKLLADASATAAKAHEQVEPDICEEEDDEEDEEDIFDDDDDDDATSDTLVSENGLFFRRRSLSVSECDSESDRNQPVLDISKKISKLRQRDVAITQLLQEAVEKANTRNSEGYGLPSSGVNSEQTVKASANFPKPALCALRFLGSHLFNAQSPIKRLRIRICQLGQQLTDQEAATDEIIERLCLRCHHLETRLAEKKQAMLSSVINEQETTFQIGTDAGNASADHEKADKLSPHDREHESAMETLSNMQSRYSSLNALYEAALKR